MKAPNASPNASLLTLSSLLRSGKLQLEREKMRKAESQRKTPSANSAPSSSPQLQWHDLSRVTLFDAQTCTLCGSTTHAFVGDFLEQQHITNGTRRLARIAGSDTLPHTTKAFTSTIPACFRCHQEQQKS